MVGVLNKRLAGYLLWMLSTLLVSPVAANITQDPAQSLHEDEPVIIPHTDDMVNHQSHDLYAINSLSKSLPERLIQLANEAGVTLDKIGMMVTPINRPNESLIEHYAYISRTPASTQKLVTTAVALETLGANFYWHNRLYAKGAIVGKTLYGDLVVVGSGDPSLNHRALDNLFATLHSKGIHHITGDIIIDNSLFVDVEFDPFVFDGQGYRTYNAAPSAFLVNFGALQVDFLPSGTWQTKNGQAVFVPNTALDRVAVSIKPALSDFEYPTSIPANTNDCHPLKSSSMQLTQSSLSIDEEYSVHCGATSVWINYANNKLLAQKSIEEIWRRLDRQFAGRVLVSDEPIKTQSLPIVSQSSRSLAKQIHDINQYSNNVMTEQLALSIPVYAYHAKNSNYASAFTTIRNWWREHLTSPSPIMNRASGLCRDCEISPASMVELLNFMYRSPNFSAFQDSLPIAGETGTMRGLSERSRHNVAIGKAYIKTGRLDDVASIAGYVNARSGQVYAISIMVNDMNAGKNPKVLEFMDEALNIVAQQ